MAKQQRMSRKEVLNQPDPSEVFMMRISVAIDWIKENQRYILYGVAGVIAVALFIILWNTWQGHRREQASIMLHQALKLVNQSDPKQDAKPDEAIKQLQTLTKQYGRTPAGARAYWHLGHLYFERGEMPEALKAYQVARRRTPNRQTLSSTLAILNMGYAQEATDACGEAITSYESVQQSPVRWLYGEAYLGIGRCHEKSGATDKAIDIYDRALNDTHVTGAAHQTITERLARLQPDEAPAELPVKFENKRSDAVEPNPGEDKTAEEVEKVNAPESTDTAASQPAETNQTAEPPASDDKQTAETAQPDAAEPAEAKQTGAETPAVTKTPTEDQPSPAPPASSSDDKPDDNTASNDKRDDNTEAAKSKP